MGAESSAGPSSRQTLSPSLADLPEDAVLRRRIKAELASFNIKPSDRWSGDPRIQSIAAWHSGFLKALRHPDPKLVIDRFVPELVRLLREPVAPGESEPPFSAELFGKRPMPIIQHIVSKLRDPRWLLYSAAFDQEAKRVLAEAKLEKGKESEEETIPPELLAQLREIEANVAGQNQMIEEIAEDIIPLPEDIQAREADLLARIHQVAVEHIHADARIRAGAENLRLRDLEHREFLQQNAKELHAGAERAEARLAGLQHRLNEGEAKLRELDQANAQLQKDVEEARKAAEDNKSSWLAYVVCFTASAVASWATGMPILITPDAFPSGSPQ